MTRDRFVSLLFVSFIFLPLHILTLFYILKKLSSSKDIVVIVTYFTFENKLMEAGQLTSGEVPWSPLFQAVFSHTYT